jgi:phosphoribosylaminoimidazole-succinocarboxamide synthase
MSATLPTIFHDNPRRMGIDLDDRSLAALCGRAAAQFATLPLVHRGQSSEIRRTPHPGLLVQRFLPSLNSISRQRKGTVPGSERLRHDISSVFWTALHGRRIPTCHLARCDDVTLVSEERIPPVEVVVKAALIGTPARIYDGLFERTDRLGRRFEPNQVHEPYVRFDYRNPLRSASGERLRDECLPIGLADRFIDTRRAAESALRVFTVIRELLHRVQLDALDACFLFDESGQVLSYEVSPDNMRIKRADWPANPEPAAEFDKDLWRDGHDGARLLAQWTNLRSRLEAR